MKKLLAKLFLFTFPLLTHAQAIWTRGFPILTPRENLFQLDAQTFQQKVMEGRRHALIYPVTAGKTLLPYRPMVNFFETPPDSAARRVLYELAKVVSPFQSVGEVFDWLGLHEYPRIPEAQTPNAFPELDEIHRNLPLGATIIHNSDGEGLTFGCAVCHSADLFGVKVLGLSNRFPRANAFFDVGAKLLPYVNSFVFKSTLDTTEGERKMYVQTKHALKYVGTKKPVTLGLDTSLAQVALSLAKRERDPYAKRGPLSYRFPRRNKLESMVADSKPAVWWNLKYKNRWLSDGSIVSGNPILTNVLWNEIGRGTDLRELEIWIKENHETVNALTAAIFATQAPRYEKFFGSKTLDIEKARRGQRHFVQSCQKCHGQYEKAWDSPQTAHLNEDELVQTTRVIYHEDTPVIDVGTDPGRYLGMKEFAQDLNRLAISKAMGTVVEPQKGYVPPPLVGIWARWPYFHNNSIPNLCALLTRSKDRPKSYWAGASNDKNRDFDSECVGYPLGEKTPQSWKKNQDYLYDTGREGLSNAGHDERIFLKNGKELYSWDEKLELIEFLKTL